MATIRKEFDVARPAAEVWAAFADTNAIHTRLARGFVTNTVGEEGGRRVTFANGMVVLERIVTIDPTAHRLVYSVADSPNLSHHSASFQVLEVGAGARVVWTADILPDAAAPALSEIMDAGVASMKATLAAG